MNETQTLHHCLNCDRSEAEIPLVALRYAGQAGWICSQCLPTLIHHPQRLAGQLQGAEEFSATPPNED